MYNLKFFFIILFCMFSYSSLLAAGVTYSGADHGYCTLWDTARLIWPQTIMGKEKAKCRKRATKASTGTIICRFSRTYIDNETNTKFCVYNKQTGDKFTMSVGNTEKCPVKFQCKR